MAEYEPAEDMLQLLAEATEKELWLYASYQGLWFSPSALQEEWRNGRFRWGARNFMLRDPACRVIELEKAVKDAEAELAAFTDHLMVQRIEQSETTERKVTNVDDRTDGPARTGG